jgi:hypothetical protein
LLSTLIYYTFKLTFPPVELPPIDIPEPEKAIYEGGGGGVNYSVLRSSRPTSRLLEPFFYFN